MNVPPNNAIITFLLNNYSNEGNQKIVRLDIVDQVDKEISIIIFPNEHFNTLIN